MPTVLRMPEVAANATEAVLAEWLVEEAASFAATDAIATVETEKAVVDYEVDIDGVFAGMLLAEGESADVGTPIAVVAIGGQSAIAGHIHISQGAQLAAASGVMRDVPAGERWGGCPAKPIRTFFREQTVIKKLAAREEQT